MSSIPRLPFICIGTGLDQERSQNSDIPVTQDKHSRCQQHRSEAQGEAERDHHEQQRSEQGIASRVRNDEQ